MKRAYILLLCASILTGCTGITELEEAAVKAKQQKSENKLDEKDYDTQLKEWEDFYKDQKRPLEEIIAQNIKERTKESKLVFERRDKYENPTEFAHYVSEVLFQFHRGQMDPKEYLLFLNKYGSDTYLQKMLVKDVEKDLRFIKDIQKLMKGTGIRFKSYRISDPKISDTNSSKAVFFREVLLDSGQKAYYKTEIYKENGFWTLENDEISNPVIIETD